MRRWICALGLVACLSTPPVTAKEPLPTVVVTGLSKAHLERLQAAAPGVTLVYADDPAALQEAIAGADGFIGRPTPELLRAGKTLRWIQVLSAGVDRYRFPELVDSEIVLTNAKIIQGPNVADQALALLLVLTRRLHVALRQRELQDWRGTRATMKGDAGGPIELHGKTALVVGLGGIGTAIAERLAGFGMRVEAIDRTPDESPPGFVAAVHRPPKLREALTRAHVVVLAVPLTDETRGMMGAEELEAMRDDAYLVNIARGAVIDTNALVKVLSEGRLAGAGLDVTDPEPLPPEHPLWTLPNAVITPHMGGTSDGIEARRLELVEDNLGRFSRGEPLRNVVDKARGY